MDEGGCSALVILKTLDLIPAGNYLIRLSLFPGHDYYYHKDIELTLHVGVPESVEIGGGFDDDMEIEL